MGTTETRNNTLGLLENPEFKLMRTRLRRFAGGGLIFDSSGILWIRAGASTQGRGTFLYGAGADYVLTRHFSLRAEYRGFVYKSRDFGLASLRTDSWTHTATICWNRLSILGTPGQPGNRALPRLPRLPKDQG